MGFHTSTNTCECRLFFCVFGSNISLSWESCCSLDMAFEAVLHADFRGPGTSCPVSASDTFEPA